MSVISSVALTITSPAFPAGGFIPSLFSCQGESKHPPIHIDNIPANAESMSIIVDDPDAPKGTFVHWVAWNISPIKEISDGSNPGVQGINGKNITGYTGPCPPDGSAPHHYHFKVYALDIMLQLPSNTGKDGLLAAMNDHIVAEGQLIGLYAKG